MTENTNPYPPHSPAEAARHATAEAVHRATWAFNLHWQNDQALYLAVLAYAKDSLRGVPGMSSQTIGINVRDNVRRWCEEERVSSLGWGPKVYPMPVSPDVLRRMREEVKDFGLVALEEVGDAVREALGIEVGDMIADCEHARTEPHRGMTRCLTCDSVTVPGIAWTAHWPTMCPHCGEYDPDQDCLAQEETPDARLVRRMGEAVALYEKRTNAKRLALRRGLADVQGALDPGRVPGDYGWTGWEAETELGNDDDREGVYFLTITDPDGEEFAVIIHRVTEENPLDGPLAKRKEADAQEIADALNAFQGSASFASVARLLGASSE